MFPSFKLYPFSGRAGESNPILPTTEYPSPPPEAYKRPTPSFSNRFRRQRKILKGLQLLSGFLILVLALLVCVGLPLAIVKALRSPVYIENEHGGAKSTGTKILSIRGKVPFASLPASSTGPSHSFVPEHTLPPILNTLSSSDRPFLAPVNPANDVSASEMSDPMRESGPVSLNRLGLDPMPVKRDSIPPNGKSYMDPGTAPYDSYDPEAIPKYYSGSVKAQIRFNDKHGRLIASYPSSKNKTEEVDLYALFNQIYPPKDMDPDEWFNGLVTLQRNNGYAKSGNVTEVNNTMIVQGKRQPTEKKAGLRTAQSGQPQKREKRSYGTGSLNINITSDNQEIEVAEGHSLTKRSNIWGALKKFFNTIGKEFKSVFTHHRKTNWTKRELYIENHGWTQEPEKASPEKRQSRSAIQLDLNPAHWFDKEDHDIVDKDWSPDETTDDEQPRTDHDEKAIRNLPSPLYDDGYLTDEGVGGRRERLVTRAMPHILMLPSPKFDGPNRLAETASPILPPGSSHVDFGGIRERLVARGSPRVLTPRPPIYDVPNSQTITAIPIAPTGNPNGIRGEMEARDRPQILTPRPPIYDTPNTPTETAIPIYPTGYPSCIPIEIEARDLHGILTPRLAILNDPIFPTETVTAITIDGGPFTPIQKRATALIPPTEPVYNVKNEPIQTPVPTKPTDPNDIPIEKHDNIGIDFDRDGHISDDEVVDVDILELLQLLVPREDEDIVDHPGFDVMSSYIFNSLIPASFWNDDGNDGEEKAPEAVFVELDEMITIWRNNSSNPENGTVGGTNDSTRTTSLSPTATDSTFLVKGAFNSSSTTATFSTPPPERTGPTHSFAKRQALEWEGWDTGYPIHTRKPFRYGYWYGFPPDYYPFPGPKYLVNFPHDRHPLTSNQQDPPTRRALWSKIFNSWRTLWLRQCPWADRRIKDYVDENGSRNSLRGPGTRRMLYDLFLRRNWRILWNHCKEWNYRDERSPD